MAIAMNVQVPMSAVELHKFIHRHMEVRSIDPSDLTPENYDPNVSPIPCDDFATIIDSLRSCLNVTEPMEDTLAVTLACTLSTSLGGLPIWCHVVGPASSGKTTVLELVYASHPYCRSISKFTGLHSGYRAGASTKDCSLFEMLRDKTLFIKDFTTVLAMSPDGRDRIFSELRDAFDGETSNNYRNGIKYEFKNLKFGVITGVTDAIRRFNTTNLGERFVHCQIDGIWDRNFNLTKLDTTDETISMAIGSQLASLLSPIASSNSRMVEQKGMIWGFLDYLQHIIMNDPRFIKQITGNIESRYSRFFTHLARLVEMCRADLHNPVHRAQLTSPTRTAITLAKLAVCLCIVYGLATPDERVLRVVMKVALDTCITHQQDVILCLARHNKTGALMSDVLREVSLTETPARKILEDLEQYGLIVSSSKLAQQSKIQRGRPAKTYFLPLNVIEGIDHIREMLG